MDRATEQVNRLFAARRDRREVMRWGVAASGVAAIAALGVAGPTAAQDASPVPVEGPDGKVMYLFVQAFHNGSWQPGAEDGTYTLTLNGGLASTIYFSDRPERIYGAAPTAGFLDTLGFTTDNPPNAALVVNSDGVADILVIELFDPVYDDAGQTLTYTAKVLEAYHETGLEYLAVQQADQSLPQEFGAGALFIDDCADHVGWCELDGAELPGTRSGGWGFCYYYPFCIPCRDYDPDCNGRFSECEGRCEWNFAD